MNLLLSLAHPKGIANDAKFGLKCESPTISRNLSKMKDFGLLQLEEKGFGGIWAGNEDKSPDEKLRNFHCKSKVCVNFYKCAC